MLTNEDIQQLAKSYGGQAPSDARNMVERAFGSLLASWRYASDDAVKSEIEADFTKLRELKGYVKLLNADAQYELFHLVDFHKMTFRFALDKDVLSYISSFNKILAPKDVARYTWDGEQYSTSSLATEPVYQQFYALLPDLSFEDRSRLYDLREDIRSLERGVIQSSFFGALKNITYSSDFTRQEHLDFFLDGHAIRFEQQYKLHLKAPEACGNLFFVLSQMEENEKQDLLRIAPIVGALGTGSDQSHFLRGLWSASSPENRSFFLDGQMGTIDYMTRYKPFLSDQRARDNAFLALAHLSEDDRTKLWSLRQDIQGLGEIGQDNYMRNLRFTSEGTYENVQYADAALTARQNLLEGTVVNAGAVFFSTGDVKGTVASHVFDALPWLSPQERQSLVDIQRELRLLNEPSDFLSILKGGPHLNASASGQDATPPETRAFLLREGFVSFYSSLGKLNASDRLVKVIATLSPDQREKLWDAREELRILGDDANQTSFLDYINWLQGRGKADEVIALLEKDVLQEIKGMKGSQLYTFMEKIEEIHEQLSDFRDVLEDKSNAFQSSTYTPSDQEKLRQYLDSGVGTKVLQARARARRRADERAFQEALATLSKYSEVQFRLTQCWKTLDPLLNLTSLGLTKALSAILPFLMHVKNIDVSNNDLSGVSESELYGFGGMKNLQVLVAQNCNLREFPRIDGLEQCSMDLTGNPCIPLPMQDALRDHYGGNIRIDERQIQIETYMGAQGHRWVSEAGIPQEMGDQRRTALDLIGHYLSDTIAGELHPTELCLTGIALGNLPEALFHVAATEALTHVSVDSCQLVGTLDLSGLRYARKLEWLDISDNSLTDHQDFSALKDCVMLGTIRAEGNPIAFLPDGIDNLPAGTRLHLDEHRLEDSAKIEASIFNGLRSTGKHAIIDIGGETASRVSRIARLDIHTKNIEEVNRKIQLLQSQQGLLPSELEKVEHRWTALQEMLQKQEDAHLIHSHIALYGSQKMQHYYHDFRAFGSTLLHGSHALRNVTIRPDAKASTGSTTARTLATNLAQAVTSVGSHLTTAQPAIGLPVGALGKALDFAVQFIEQRDFNRINNRVAAFLEREEVDTFIHALSRPAAWSMEEKWEREKLQMKYELRAENVGGRKTLFKKATKASQGIAQKVIKASSEELAFTTAVITGKAAPTKEETLIQQRASEDVCSLIIGMAFGKPWPLKTRQEIREMSTEEKLIDGLAWFSSGKHRSKHPSFDDTVRSKSHLLVVDKSTDEKVNDLTKHLMLATLDNTQTIAEQRQWVREQDARIEELERMIKSEQNMRQNLVKALKRMPGFENLYLGTRNRDEAVHETSSSLQD